MPVRQQGADSVEGMVFPGRQQDPKFSDCRAYLNYYDNEMTAVMQQRLECLRRQHNDNEAKNRYADILPYRHTQPRGGYYNGNHVTLGELHFFISQAPLDVLEFHDLVYDLDARQIIQVSPFIEQGIPKVTRYLPLHPDEPPTFRTESVQAAVALQELGLLYRTKSANELPFYRDRLVTTRGLTITTTDFVDAGPCYAATMHYAGQGGACRDVQYLYFKDWPDYAAPDNLYHVYDLCRAIRTDHPIVVHCSAGIGRSSTFAVCMYLYYRLVVERKPYRELSPSIFDAVEELRLTRNPICVYTRQYFWFLFYFANHCLNIVKGK